MARITVEDCLEKVNTRFSLVHLAAKRVRQLRKGAEPLVVCKNKDIVVSLREIAKGKIFPSDEETTQFLVEPETEPLKIQPAEQTDPESPDKGQGDQEVAPEAK
jgi:DNA-directed RNA polymerase omega subunit